MLYRHPQIGTSEMPFAVGERVVCLDSDRTRLTVGREYRIFWVSPLGLAVRVEGQNIDYLARRFRAIEVPVIEPAPTPPPPAPVAPPEPIRARTPYTAHPFEGCCGASLIYMHNQVCYKASLEDVLDDDYEDDDGYRVQNVAFIILNETQHTEAAKQALAECDFEFVTTSRANGGGVLYTYMWHRHPHPVFTPVERQRAF